MLSLSHTHVPAQYGEHVDFFFFKAGVACSPIRLALLYGTKVLTKDNLFLRNSLRAAQSF